MPVTDKEFNKNTKYYTMHACPIATPSIKEECADLDWINKLTGQGCLDKITSHKDVDKNGVTAKVACC